MGDGGEKYYCVLLESGGYHGDGGKGMGERERERLHTLTLNAN